MMVLSLRVGLDGAPLAAAEAAGSGGHCATGGEIARLRCQLDEATERLDLAVKAKELAVEGKEVEFARREAMFALALEAKDAELAQKKALVSEQTAQIAHMKATIETLRAAPCRMEEVKDTEPDREVAPTRNEDTPDVGWRQALLLEEDRLNITAQRDQEHARAKEPVHDVAPRPRGAVLDAPVPREEARSVPALLQRLPGQGGSTTWTARPGARGHARAERRLRGPDDDLRRRGRRLRDVAPEIATSWLGTRPARSVDRLGDAELWPRRPVNRRGAVDGERRYGDLEFAGGRKQEQEHRHGVGLWRGDGRLDGRFATEGPGRQLAGDDLPTIIAGLPDNTTRISLPSMALTGTLPADLGRLADLEYLDVSGNSLTGTLPAALFWLTKLQVLQLQENQLTGPLPAQIGNMAAMVWLDLSGNNLGGTLPVALCDAVKLLKLNLHRCQLEGSVPSCLGSLPRLERLDVGSNRVSGTVPTQLGNLTHLTYIDLSVNQLSGTIPPDFGNLTQLTCIDLSVNQLSGTIPPDLGKLAQLNRLDTSYNQLSGTIPPDLGKLTQLTDLILNSNQLSGTIPPDLGNLTQLNRFYLSYNQLSGAIPPDLGKLTQLTYLRLLNNQLSGTIPPDLGNLTQLNELFLDTNQLSGTIPPNLGNLMQLKQLVLDYNQLSGNIPPDLGKLTQLTTSTLTNNKLTGTVPKELGRLVKLRYLWLSVNQLSGTIPPDLGKLAQLSQLYLEKNQLSGMIPPALSNLTQLAYLVLPSNNLSGTIPPDLGKLTHLTQLVLGNNQFTGTVPEELGNLVELTYLDLSSNQLSGTIPPDLGKLTQLDGLTIHDNQLTGTIPKELGNLVNLVQAYLSNNQFSGTIPSSMTQWTSLTSFSLASNRLTGTLPPDFWRLSQLSWLSLGNNLLAGTVPSELFEGIVQLQHIDLSRNNFSGTLPEWMGQIRALQAVYVQENPHLTGTFPDTTNCPTLFHVEAQGCGFTSAGAVGGSVLILSFANNSFAELPPAWVNLSAVQQLDLSDNRIMAWMPFGVLPYGTFYDDTYFDCGVGPLRPRLNWPAVESVDLSGNPLGRATTPRNFIWSLAYIPQLSELRAARCHLQGELPYEGPSFAVDMENTGAPDCSGAPPARRDGFRALFSLDLSENNLSSVMSQPPTRLHTAALHSNALSGLNSRWYSLAGTLEVWRNPLLRADVLPPSREVSCPTEGARSLEADPLGWVTRPGDDFQCTGLCAGPDTRYKHDSVLNASSLCRCTVGRQGAAMDCTGCPANTYSQGEDAFAMRRVCRLCPASSSTDGAKNATSVNECKCPAGWYMHTPPAGSANETNNGTSAPACARCKQRQFMETMPGATKEDECFCNRNYDGLRAVLGICGCADGLYMDHLARACRQCDPVAEQCAWGSALDLSLRPPVVEASYWAAPAPEPGADEAFNFSRHDIWRCFSRSTCKGDSVCAAGRSGTACSLCDAGMYGGPDGPCQPCPASPEESRRALLYGLLIGPAATLAAHVALQSSADSRGLAFAMANLRTSLKQSVKYLQMLGVLSAFDVNWPPLARQFLTDIPRITVALPQILGVACLAGQQSASLEMGFRWLLPVAGLGSACLSAVLLVPVRCCCRDRRWYRRVRMSAWDVLRVCLWGLTLFYSTLLQFGTQVLTCTPSPNGQSTVLTFPHLVCGGTGEWTRLAAMSAAFLLLFVIAVYLGVYAAWRRTTRTLVDTAFQSAGWWGFLFDDFRSGWGHWVMLTMAKDTALVVIATAGASDGPSQLLATAAGGVMYSYAVLRDQPFRDPSNSVLEAWIAMSLAVVSVYAAGMGYPSTPNVADVADLYPGGGDNALFKRRERALLVLQWLTVAGPAGVILFQLLGMSDRTRRIVPSLLRPWKETEWAEWNADFLRRLNLDTASPDFLGVVQRFDTVDNARFRRVMSTSMATLGIVDGSGGGINGMVRRRFSEAARSSESFQSVRLTSLNSKGPAVDSKGPAVDAGDFTERAAGEAENQPAAVCPRVGRRNEVERAVATKVDVVTL